MIKKHNFIAGSYLEEKNQKDKRLYQAAVLLMILLNALVLRQYYNERKLLEESKSRAVFKPIENRVPQKQNYTESFSSIYKKIMGYIKGSIRVKSLRYQNNTINVELFSRESSEFIQLIREIETEKKFDILKVSPITSGDVGFSLSMELHIS